MNSSSKKVYIIISQTGSIVSKVLGLITGDMYNHVSVSLQGDLQKMYSFGRRIPYVMMPGGFVMESLGAGTFRRFPDAKGVVLVCDISSEQYYRLNSRIDDMYSRRFSYCYNYIGLALAAFNIYRKFNKRYYCSEFVKELLSDCDVIPQDCLGSIVKPMEFLQLDDFRIIYDGRLQDYSINENIFSA